MASQNRCSSAIRVCNRSRESCSPQMAVPRTLMPSGCQASRPNVVHQDIRLLLCSTPSSFPGGECPPLATDTCVINRFHPFQAAECTRRLRSTQLLSKLEGGSKLLQCTRNAESEGRPALLLRPVRLCVSVPRRTTNCTVKKMALLERKRKDSANSRRRQSSVAALRAWPCAPVPSTLSMVAWVTRIERAHTHLQNQKQIALRASRPPIASENFQLQCL